MKINLNKNRKGVALIVIAIAVVLMFIMAGAMAMLGFQSRVRSIRFQQDIMAREAADAGHDRAMFMLNDSSNNSAIIAGTFEISGTGTLDGTSQTYTYVNPIVPSIVDGRWVADIVVEGRASAESDHVRTVISRAVLSSAFDYALMVKDTIEFKSKVLIDGYDSDAGSYGGSNSGDPVTMGTQDDDDGDVTFKNGVDTSSDSVIVVGSGAIDNPEAVVDDKSGFEGEVIASTEEVPLPSITFFMPANINDDTVYTVHDGTTLETWNDQKIWVPDGLVIQSDTLTLGSDVQEIHISGGLNLKVNGSLIINGQTKVYVYNSSMLLGQGTSITLGSLADVDIYLNTDFTMMQGAALNNPNSDPTKMSIFATAGCALINISNSGQLYASIYAPDSDIELDNSGELYGSIVGDNILVRNSGSFHYDLALSRLNPGEFTYFRTTRWYEE